MSEWTPKVGDMVMVGEHGPYSVEPAAAAGMFDAYRGGADDPDWVGTFPDWMLTPAPEPEPDEPTAPGALVRFGEHLAVQRGAPYDKPWLILTGPLQGSVRKWSELTTFYPITVILADPAEVERLRGAVTGLRERVEEERTLGLDWKRCAARLQRRIDDTLLYLDSRESLVVSKQAASLLRGDS